MKRLLPALFIMAAVRGLFADSVPAFDYEEMTAAEVKTNRHRQVTFVLPEERIGYFTVRGERIGDGLVSTNRYVAHVKDALELEDVVFHAAKCPIDLGSLSFECSDGNLRAFWLDCLRLTENKVIARRLGWTETAARYGEELKTSFAAAMPNAQETSNPLGVIVRYYLGISTDKEGKVVTIFPKLVQGMTRMAGQVPTSLGNVKVEALHLRGCDFTVEVEIPAGSYGSIITPKWGVGAEVDGVSVRPKIADGRYAFAVSAGRHTVRLLAPRKKVFPQPGCAYDLGKIQIEKLDRGFVAVRNGGAVLSWRYLPTDPTNIAFNVYMNGKLLTADEPLANATHFTAKFLHGAKYRIEAVVPDGAVGWRKTGEEITRTIGEKPYIKIPMRRPPQDTTADGQVSGHYAEEASPGDMDGDGEYEIVVKWSSLSGQDNAQNGHTGQDHLDCYKLDGTFLWRISLGPNIRSGHHYTHFMVYDFDGDGKSEVICRTADGTVDGKGKVIGDAKKRWANEYGRILSGPEYLTVFNGLTGEAMATVDFVPARGNVSDWGDSYGNRCDRFLACVAYLDGVHPSAVFCRGYYAKSMLAAWDWDGKKLKLRWVFDSSTPGNEAYAGQGFHSVRTGDVDLDGKDEIVYGSMVVDDDGKGLYSTGFGHGDGQHLVQARPDLRGLHQWTCHENRRDGLVLRYADDGKVIWQRKLPFDVPTCVAADIDPTNPGYEFWMGKGYDYWDVYGRPLPGIPDLAWHRDLVWWKGDMLRSRFYKARIIASYDWRAKKWETDMSASKDVSGEGVKRSRPILAADLFGDWREELVLPGDKGDSLLVFTSPHPTKYRFWSFMLDPMYRAQVAAWNTAYNQAPQTGFYFGPDLLGRGIWFRGMYLP